MYCKRCGKEIPEGEKYCPLCGEPVEQDLSEYRVYGQQDNGGYNGGNYQPQRSNDTGSFWWGLLACFIPIVGIILYICWRKSKPRTAKVILIGFIIGIVFNLISNMILINLIEPGLEEMLPTEPVNPGIPNTPNNGAHF